MFTLCCGPPKTTPTDLADVVLDEKGNVNVNSTAAEPSEPVKESAAPPAEPVTEPSTFEPDTSQSQAVTKGDDGAPAQAAAPIGANESPDTGKAQNGDAVATGQTAATEAPTPATETGLLSQDDRWQKTMNDGGKTTQNFLRYKERRPSTTNITLQAYTDQHKKDFESLLALEPNTGWTFKHRDNEVDVYTKQMQGLNGNPCVGFKGFTQISTTGESVKDIVLQILSIEDRPKWDEQCSFGETVEQQLPFYRYSLYRTISPFPLVVSPREILLCGRLCFEDSGGILVCIRSVDLPDIVAKPPYVRAKFEGGYIFRPGKVPNTIDVMFAGIVDPMGGLPGWVKDLVAPKQCQSLWKFKKWYAEKKK
eukprot:gnl/TRDRNA2_/TRDRNA2_89004_c0_seq1.p1 gnl/TRDRNA2_/TRDRNA2_89004_c0~~gnl/TRDRNA2_/TRDRNA2_89004_c0_seq1.p1  ORF type:complete len:365 (+),score=50.91 gnl/TRDRNA2_/TRDRNA2_89004_c0_seq1:93-1187(+)